MDHLPLSQRLSHFMRGCGNEQSLTLHQIIERTEGAGFYLLIVFLALPLVLPISIPGAGNLLGMVIGFLALRLLAGQSPRLPGFVGRRTVSLALQEKLLRGSARALRFLDRISRRRKTGWLKWRVAHIGNALLMVLMAVLLALPIPLPFSNPLPSSAVILLAVSMMEEDGVLIWFGYAAAAGAVSFFAFFGGVTVELFGKICGI